MFMRRDRRACSLGTFATALCVSLLLTSCWAEGLPQETVATFKSPDGNIIFMSRNQAIIQGTHYKGNDCSTKHIQCIDYSGYFSIIAPKRCKDMDKTQIRSGSLVTTPLGLDHHNSATMYGVNRGEMVAYIYSWNGDGVVGLAFDGTHKIASPIELQKMGYRDPSIFYRKTAGPAFLPCTT